MTRSSRAAESGARIITLKGWNNPDTLATQFVADIATASNNLATYVAGPRVELDAFPVRRTASSTPTRPTYLSWPRQDPSTAKCHKPDQAHGLRLRRSITWPCSTARTSARVSTPASSTSCGCSARRSWASGRRTRPARQAINTNGPIVVGSTCQGRLNIFGFAYHVGDANMLHDYGHRIDGTLFSLLPNGGSVYERVSAQRSAQPGTGPVRHHALHADQHV